jgi:putative transposase
MRHRLFVHLVWTTLDRAPLIDFEAARMLSEQIPVVARQERATPLEIGIVSTHLHLVLRLHPATPIPRLVQRLKGTTSFCLGRLRRNGPKVRWAPGYTVQIVSQQALPNVCRYVATQPERHPGEAIPGWPRVRSTS